MKKNYFKKEVFVPTTENWHPNYSGDTVRVVLMLNIPDCESPGRVWHRVSVWGNDDHGMEKDFLENEADQARLCFEKVRDSKNVTHKALEKLEFAYV